MKKWIKRIGILVVGIAVFFIITCFVFDAFVQFRMSDKEWLNLFSSHHINGQVRYLISEGRNIRYISAGNDTLPTIVFIHGAPSSSSIYKIFFTDSSFLHTFHILAIDRHGYGYSGFGKPVISLQQQAFFIKEMLQNMGKTKHPIIVVAGSYGTTVACRFAMDYPQLADGLVLTG
ncbi:MAG: alpha/beta hydrolase, partial [Bacteroidota bacterium]|nr:alpha/beta hydrolase [Bacteroidota bacterium]